MVHVSIQLFSNEMLAFKMVREENLLSKMIFVLTKMIQECTNDFVMQLEGKWIFFDVQIVLSSITIVN